MPLYLDLQNIEEYGRQYMLNKFTISGQILPDRMLFHTRPRHKKLLSNLLYKLRYGRQTKLIDPECMLDKRVFEITRDTYLEGYWQSEKYFADCVTEIRKEFRQIHRSSLDSRRLLEMLRGKTSVSIHIRRGDYVTNPEARRIHGVCPMEYYVEGLEKIKARLHSDPIIGVFSDDLEWARKNFRLDGNMVFVDHRFSSGVLDDFRLMSKFNHHIIANSSFSWWAAWLNSDTNKMVICPDPFFRKPSLVSRDIVPDSWTKVRVDWN